MFLIFGRGSDHARVVANSQAPAHPTDWSAASAATADAPRPCTSGAQSRTGPPIGCNQLEVGELHVNESSNAIALKQ
jgi:hypothetical protein